MGRDIDDAVAKVQDLLTVIGDEILSGYDWRSQRAIKGPKAHLNAVLGAANYLRDPATPGNQVEEGEPTVAQRFRQASAQLARMYALCSRSGALVAFRPDIAFFEEIRAYMARFDVQCLAPSRDPLSFDEALGLVVAFAVLVPAGLALAGALVLDVDPGP